MNVTKNKGSDMRLAVAAIGLTITLALLTLAPEAAAQANAPNDDAASEGMPTLILDTAGFDACSDGYGLSRSAELSCAAIPELASGFGFSTKLRTDLALSAAWYTVDMILTALAPDDAEEISTVELGPLVLSATASTLARDGEIKGAAVGLLGWF